MRNTIINTACQFQRFLKGVLLIIIVSSALKVQGQDLDSDNDGIPDSYERGMGDFSLDNVFNMTGADNSAIELNAGEIQLTQDGTSLRGSAMSVGQIDFSMDFTFSVEAYFGINRGTGDSNSGADGIAMVFHNDNDGSNAIGNDGEGMGAQGIQNGIVLEIDTYGNGNTGADDPMRGTTDDHTDIWDSDDSSRSSLIGGYILYNNAGDQELEDGEYHLIVFTWEASTGTLSFTIDGLNAGSITRGSVSSFVNSFFGGSRSVHFGFTASTGAAKNEHKIRINDTGNLPLVIDTDNDGIYDHLDLDSDNDGIYDAEEAGHGAPHTNGVVNGPVGTDGIPDAVQNDPNNGGINYTINDADGDGISNHQDLDADNDGCNDAIEALFSDSDNDGILGTGIPTVNSLGVVISASNGYTTPTNDYLDNSISVCVPIVDLGDAGDGFDEEIIYTEDDPATNVVDAVAIQDRNNLVFVNMQIVVAGVLDGTDEILTVAGVEFILNSQVTNPVTVNVNGENVNITFINNVFTFFATTGDAALDLVTCEQIIESIQYHHSDLATPTGGNRVLTVTVNDGTNTSQPNTITVQVVPVNDPPVAVDNFLNLNALAFASIDIAVNDYDIDGTIDVTSISVINIPIHGTVSINGDGTITYRKDGAQATSDSLTYIVLDDGGAVSNVATVQITMTPSGENGTPVALPDFAQVEQGDTLEVAAGQGVLLNDTDPDSDGLTVISFTINGISYPAGTIASLPEGQLTINRDGSYIFNPAPTFTGVLEVGYMITDGEATANSTLSITVIAPETPAEEEVEVSSIITRNGDLFNGFLRIVNIDSYPENRVNIFNRWGNKVWETEGYQNGDSNRRFEGLGNVGSSGELPDGTYYYVINKGDGSTPIKGFLTLKH
ncbi:lectin-like domain-containing protein [Ekhidna sp.]